MKNETGQCGIYLSGLLEEISKKHLINGIRGLKRFRNTEDREKVRDESSMKLCLRWPELMSVLKSTVDPLLNPVRDS